MPAAGLAAVDAFLRGDAEAVVSALAPDATFRSPVADYHGRERFGPVLAALAQVVREATAVRVHDLQGETVAAFTATVEGRPAEGILRIVADGDAPATELVLMVRPLETLLAGVKAMARILGSEDR